MQDVPSIKVENNHFEKIIPIAAAL
jgi:hypothetical protein